jgi:hypothetical protein
MHDHQFAPLASPRAGPLFGTGVPSPTGAPSGGRRLGFVGQRFCLPFLQPRAPGKFSGEACDRARGVFVRSPAACRSSPVRALPTRPSARSDWPAPRTFAVPGSPSARPRVTPTEPGSWSPVRTPSTSKVAGFPVYPTRTAWSRVRVSRTARPGVCTLLRVDHHVSPPPAVVAWMAATWSRSRGREQRPYP